MQITDFESISKDFLNDRMKILLQNDKIINRLKLNKNSSLLNESLFDSSMTYLLPTQKSPSNSDTPQFTRTLNQTSITGFSHIPKVNIPDEPIPAKFRNLITERGNEIKVIDQNEIKEHLKNKTPKSDQSVTNFYLKEVNTLEKELNKKEVLIKYLVETIKIWQQIA